MKITKEKLIEENARLKDRLQKALDKDDFIRSELSKILHLATEVEKPYGRTEASNPSWLVISAEIGQLKSTSRLLFIEQDLREIAERRSRLEERMINIEKIINK